MSLRSALLAVVTLLVSVPSWAVEVDGKDWLQPADFIYLSWNDVAAVCDSDTGACIGTLGTTNVTGYTWANVDEINGLFNAYGVTPPLSGPAEVEQAGSSWAPLFLDDFAPTEVTDGDVGYAGTYGWSRTLSDSFPYAAYIVDAFVSTELDTASSVEVRPPSIDDDVYGVWLYTDAIPPAQNHSIPTMSVWALVLMGLLLVLLARRRLVA